jgi:hypothetical protein
VSDIPSRLPQAYLEELFQGPVLDDLHYEMDGLASPAMPGRRPQLVIVAGQAGAGASMAHMQFMQGDYMHPAGIAPDGEHPDGIVSVDFESLRTYHPAYEDLRRARPQNLDAETEADTLWLQNRVADHLRTRQYNILIERDWDGPDPILLTAERFNTAGYDVHLAALAVPAPVSRLALIESFTRQADVTGTGRWISAERHDAGYTTTAGALRRAETSEAITRVSVHTRDGIVHDKQRQPNKPWPPRAPAAADVLTEARESPLPRTQRTALGNRLAAALERLERLGVAHLALHDMGAEIAKDLVGESTSPRDQLLVDLTTAMSDIAAADEILGATDSPAFDAGPEPGPDLGTPEPPEFGPGI